MTKHHLGLLGAVGTLVAGLVGCGSGFTNNCAETRTCTSPDEGAAGDSDETPSGEGGGVSDAGAAAQGGSDASVSTSGGGMNGAGAPGEVAGAGGMADSGCHSALDCSNGDPEDGEEICDATGACLPGNPPPVVLNVTPSKNATAVETDVTIVIELSEPLDAATVKTSSVKLTLGSSDVPGEVSYADSKISFKPAAPLALLGVYSVSVGVGVTDAEGAALLKPFNSQFEVRDGSWKVIDAVKDKIHGFSPVVALSEAGEAQLVWSGAAGAACPVTARRFRLGSDQALSSKTFAFVAGDECSYVTSAGNADGVTAVAWTEVDNVAGSFVQQYRDTAWQAKAPRISKVSNEYPLSVAVAPDGKVTFFAHAKGSSSAWRTDASGAWQSAGDTLSSFTAASRTSVVFDAEGNGLAVWRAVDEANTGFDRIVASRYSNASGKWSTAVDLPASVAKSISSERGYPSLAMKPNGEAVALWTGSGRLNASRYTAADGWSLPETVSDFDVALWDDAPALVFDGNEFVAAWTDFDGTSWYTYTARSGSSGWSSSELQQQTPGDGTSAARMPRLTSDGRGNSLLVWAKGVQPKFTLAYRRFAHGAWSDIAPIPGGALTSAFFEGSDGLAMSGNSAGLTALAWPNVDGSNLIASIRLASFF